MHYGRKIAARLLLAAAVSMHALARAQPAPPPNPLDQCLDAIAERAELGNLRFVLRVANHALFSVALLVVSLLIGIAGYGYFEKLPWRDGFLNSAMLLGGMGPVDAPKTDGGKLFAGCFALYAGLVFIITVGVML